MRTAGCALLVVWAASAAAEEPLAPRLWATELGIGINATNFEGDQPQFWQGRQIALRLVLRGFVFDGRAQFTTVFPLSATPVRGSIDVRLGWSGRRWAAVAGAYFLDGFNTSPRLIKLLPTAQVQVSFGEFSAVAGLWDFHLPDVPLHLSLEGKDCGVGYVLPFGIQANVRLRLLEFVGITIQGLVLQRPGGDVVAQAHLMATLGVMSGKPPGPRVLIPPILDPTR